MVQRSSSHPTQQVQAEQVRAVTVGLLADLLPLAVTGYRYGDQDIYALVVAAAAEQRSVESAARQFVAAPSANLVRHYLEQRLFAALEIAELEALTNSLLAARLPSELSRRPIDLAMDLTLLPYYGRYAEDPGELRRGEAKAGTTRFHAYATASALRTGRRVTLAVAYLYAEDALVDVVEELLLRVQALGVRIRHLYLDREFASVAVLTFLNAQPFSAIVPVPVRGARLAGQLRGRRSFKTTYTMASVQDGELTFPLYVAVRYAAGRRGKHEREYLPFAVVGQAHCELTVRQVAAGYRHRFAIESSYRLMHQGLARTSTRDPFLRLLLVTIGLLLTNLWVWLKTTLLAHTPRPERAAARAWLDEAFRLDRLRDLLIEACKARYGVHTVLAYPFRLSPAFTLPAR
jgi:hypothetical protein